VGARALVASELARALEAESDADAASDMVDAALRVGRADADALLARMERSAIARASDPLARRLADYRGALASGETDPQRIQDERRAREEARAVRGRSCP
jgi:hypothetical protein